MSAYAPYTPEFDGLTGEQIQAIADAQPPMQPAGAGIVIQGLFYTFAILCTIVFSLRVWVRIRNDTGAGWRIDDWLAAGGFAPYIPACIIAIVGTYYGVGAPDDALPNSFIKIRAKQLQLIYELVYFGSSTLTKFSIGFTILRICKQRRYAYAIYFSMGVMALTALVALVILFADCRPFATRWNPALGYCVLPAPTTWFMVSYIGTSMQVMTDWIVAITPFFVVRSLQLDKRKKMSVIAILGLGVFASFAAVMRIASYPMTDERIYPHDHLVKEAQLVIWSHMEGSFAIIACNLPPLQMLFKKFFASAVSRVGGARSTPVSGTQLSHLTPVGGQRNGGGSRGGKNWDRLSDTEDDSSSKRGIVRVTQVQVETSSVEAKEQERSSWTKTTIKHMV